MNKFLNRTVWLVVIIPIIYLALAWHSLPEKIAMHFDLQGNADKFDSKKEFFWFIIIMLAVSVGIYLLVGNIWRIDPKKYAAENKGRLQKIAFTSVVFLAAIQCFVIYIGTQGSLKLNLRFFFAVAGIFWAVISNYMYNLKPNYFAGFRLPWTLENEENWRRTHRLAGKLWFAGGLLIAAICIFTSTTISTITLFSILTIVTVIPIVYSYRLYRKQKSLKPID